MQRIALVIVCAALLAACGAGERLTGTTTTTGPPPTTIDHTFDRELELLAAARARWTASAPSDYTVAVVDRCQNCQSTPQTLAMHDGELVSLGSSETWTIEDAFETVEASLRAGAIVDVEYHPEFGFPVRIVIDRDGDGETDVDIQFGNLEAMPIVESKDQLLAAKRVWEAQGLDDYTYIFRADCTCDVSGTWEVRVSDGSRTDVRPLDDAAERASITPGPVDSAFDDLEEWFTDSGPLIDEGILDVDVRMDPHRGYPRWFRVEAKDIDQDEFIGQFVITVTIDLVTFADPVGPTPEPDPDPRSGDAEALDAANLKWAWTELENYRYILSVHCECPEDVAGPFTITVRDGEVGDQPRHMTIEDVFDLIRFAIDDGTDVSVEYDAVLGYPHLVLIDPEAVAVDGGLAFSITDFEVDGELGFIFGKVLAGPQCPVQQDPPQPRCEDQPVADASLVVVDPSGHQLGIRTNGDGSFSVALPPGEFVVRLLPMEPYLGVDEPLAVSTEDGGVVEIVVRYDTGIR